MLVPWFTHTRPVLRTISTLRPLIGAVVNVIVALDPVNVKPDVCLMPPTNTSTSAPSERGINAVESSSNSANAVVDQSAMCEQIVVVSLYPGIV